MTRPGNIFLVGPMGAGKSTVGRRLAQALGLDFVDCDRVIEERTGVGIPLIFELEGEAGFRAREKALLAELTGRPSIVLATGGGAVLDPENRRMLRARGLVIYLRTSVAEQYRRTRHDGNRPLLLTPDPKARLEEIMRLRDPLYREVADHTVVTDGCHARQVARSIMEYLE